MLELTGQVGFNQKSVAQDWVHAQIDGSARVQVNPWAFFFFWKVKINQLSSNMKLIKYQKFQFICLSLD